MRLKQALRKYSADLYKRSELVKGKLVVRRIPNAFSKQGFMETFLSQTLTAHTSRYALGDITGNLGYLIDTEREAPTLRCSPITLISTERKIQTGEGDFAITPPAVVIEFINQPEVIAGKDCYPLPVEHENEDSDDYWPTKLEDYRRFGVGLVWILDLSKEVVHEFRQPEWRSRTFRGDEKLEGGEYLPGFVCSVADLFSFEKLRAGLGRGWEATLDVELVEYIAARHREAGVVRKKSVAERELSILKMNQAAKSSEPTLEELQAQIAELERQIKEIST